MNQLTKLLRSPLFLLVALLIPLISSTYASENNAGKKTAQKWYRVEVIIFSQRDVFDDEVNPRDIVLSYPEKLIDLDNNFAGFTVLPDNERELGPDAYSLNRTGVYKVLLHKAWRQPGLAPKNAPWVIVDVVKKNSTLNGSLRVYLASYLHMESNIWHVAYATEAETLNIELLNNEARTEAGVIEDSPRTEPTSHELIPWPKLPSPSIELSATTAVTSETDTLKTALSKQPYGIIVENSGVIPTPENIDEIILLKQASRLKLNKLHYFDHPKMGLLVKVSRATAPVTNDIKRIKTPLEESPSEESSIQVNPLAQ